MSVLDDVLERAAAEEGTQPDETTGTDARPSTDDGPADPFLLAYDTSRIQADTETVEQIGNIAFLVAKVL